MNQSEQERRARLLKQGVERLPDIKKRFEEAQKRNFNSNFAPGGKDAKLVANKKKATQPKKQKNTNSPKKAQKPVKSEAEKRKINLSVSTRKGEMVHHQRMLSQDVNTQAT